MTINFEKEYCVVMCKNGIRIEIDRETALDFAKQVQDFYQDGFEDDLEVDNEDWSKKIYCNQFL